MISCDAVRQQAALFALGALDDEDGLNLEAHLDGCPDCWQDVSALRQVVGVVPYGLPDESLPRDLKARLFRRIEQDPSRPERITRPLAAEALVMPPATPVPVKAMRLPAVLAVALVLTLLWGGWQQVRLAQLQARQEELAAALEERGALLQRSQARLRDLSRQQGPLALVPGKDVNVVALTGQKAAPEASAKLVWSRQEDSWRLSVANLPPAPAKQTYQIWAATAKSKLHIGVFQTRPDGTATVKAFLPLLDGPPLAALVTVEPAGGARQPTGDIVLMGLLE